MSNALADGEALEAVRRLLGTHATVDAAYLLGSAVRGRLRPDSDIDIAILPRQADTISTMDRTELAVGLGNILGRTVDLGVLRRVVDSGHNDWIRMGKSLGVSIRP